MASRIPNTFLRAGDPIITSFDWTDIATGTGIVTFYGKRLHDGSDFVYLLSGTDLIKSLGEVSGAPLDLDFDSTLNKSSEVKGIAYVSGTFVISANGEQFSLSAQIFHFDGTTETAISSEITFPTQTASGDGDRKIFSLKMPITTDTVFTSGEILRVTMKLTRIAGGNNATLEHSSSQPLIMQIPFFVDQ